MIVLDKITKRYHIGQSELTVLSGVDFKIERGEFVSIMGSSGSGKSTLMNIIGCLDTPTSGVYQLDGEEIKNLDEAALSQLRNRKIGFVFQNFNLLGRQTVLHNVELPMMYAGFEKQERTQRAKHLLEVVGLGERLHHRPNELSGGQRQRVAIARALTMSPPLLLADEPTGNLDSKSSIEVMKIFEQINKEGTTIILVTHESDIAKCANRILLFGDGKLLKDVRRGRVVR